MSKEELKNKIKKALYDSGFPLELNMSKILYAHNWVHSLCCRYEDFETEKIRELDISAQKIINGIAVHLNIECKKSTNKQLVLYAQEKIKLPLTLVNNLKYFPRIKKSEETREIEAQVLNEFSRLPILDTNLSISKSIIFTKGDQIEQNNDSFFTSLNGIIKNAVVSASDGYIDTNFRIIYLHILIYDGLIFLLKDSEQQDFDLTETEYGQYKFNYRFNVSPSIVKSRQDIVETLKHFSFLNVIEIMTPKYFEEYLTIIENAVTNVRKENIIGWGDDWDDFL